MKTDNRIFQLRNLATAFFVAFALAFLGSGAQVLAHGGEDHGDSKPIAATSDNGTVSLTARLGEYELTFKHPFLEPDTATAAKFFITKFKTNEAIDNAAAAIEIESANGSITEAAIEKTETAGIYNVKISALPQGVYNIRAKLTYNNDTDTATFPGVEVKPKPADSAASGASWTQTALIGFVFALLLSLFGGLIYYVWNFAASDRSGKQTAVRGETVSA